MDISAPYDVIICPLSNQGIISAWCYWRTLPNDYKALLDTAGSITSTNQAIKLQDQGFSTVFVFIKPTDNIPVDLIVDKNVLILGVDLGSSLVFIVRFSKSVFLLDCHESSEHTLTLHHTILESFGNKFHKCINFMEFTSALAWRMTHTPNIPDFLLTMNGKNQKSKECIKAMEVDNVFESFTNIEHTFCHWDSLKNMYISKGTYIIEYENSCIEKHSKQIDIGFIQIKDGTIYKIAYLQANILQSEIGTSIKKYAKEKVDFSATWNYNNGVVTVSFYDPENGIDLEVVAKNIKDSPSSHLSTFSFYGLEKFHNYILKTSP